MLGGASSIEPTAVRPPFRELHDIQHICLGDVARWSSIGNKLEATQATTSEHAMHPDAALTSKPFSKLPYSEFQAHCSQLQADSALPTLFAATVRSTL